MGKGKRKRSNNGNNGNSEKRPIGTFSVTEEGSDEKQLISLFADLDLDERGEFEINDGEHTNGMFFNILKTDFETLGELKFMQLVRYQDKPELFLTEDYQYYFDESLKSINSADIDEDEEKVYKDSFYKFVAIAINITKSRGFMYFKQYEYLTNLIDTPEGDMYAPEFDDDGYYELSEFMD